MRNQDILSVVQRSGEYSEADHRNWVDEHTLIVSHMGIHPVDWNIQLLAFDCFVVNAITSNCKLLTFVSFLKETMSLLINFNLFESILDMRIISHQVLAKKLIKIKVKR